MSTKPTEAERLAQHRAEFAEAMARGISIIDLRRRKAAERQALRHRAAWEVADRTADMMDDGAAEQPGDMRGDFRRFDAFWMMRD